MSEAGFVTKTLLLARKDLKIESRGRDTLPPMLAFVAAVTLLLAFILPGTGTTRSPVNLPFGTVALGDVVAGFLWVVILFSGLIGFARTFEVEREEGALDSLLLLPLDRSGLFFSKGAANLVFVVAVEIAVIPMFALLFGLDLGIRWLAMALVVALADIAFVAIGTLFAALAAQTRSRELMLPILALPALVPVFIAGGELSADLFLGVGLGQIATRGWFAILVASDVVSLAIGAMVFDAVVE